MKKRLIAFDMDSTLIDCEVIDELARLHDCYDSVSKITNLAMIGELNFDSALLQRVALLKGLSLTKVNYLKHNLPFMQGLDELAKELHRRQYIVAILSGGFDLFAEQIVQKYQFHHFFCNQLSHNGIELDGQILGEIINAEKKARYLEKLANDYKVEMADTIAVGDGANDILMIQKAGIGIAFCAKQACREKADISIEVKDLSKICEWLK